MARAWGLPEKEARRRATATSIHDHRAFLRKSGRASKSRPNTEVVPCLGGGADAQVAFVSDRRRWPQKRNGSPCGKMKSAAR
jgi:hypothetical protein